MDDEHVRIDDLSAHLGSYFKCPSSFYAVFDGHGGPDAAAYVKRNAVRLFFEDVHLPQTSDVDDVFLRALLNSHREAFLQADSALADKSIVSSSCGTTALTALVLGRHLVVANAGDCRAVLCRKGVAVDVSQDHKPSYLPDGLRSWVVVFKVNILMVLLLLEPFLLLEPLEIGILSFQLAPHHLSLLSQRFNSLC
jgi:protein phosphatase 2C family protein 2/3